MSTCEWPIDRTCLPDLPSEGDSTYDALLAERQAAEDLAISVLWSLSGRQFGVCGYVVRPCIQTIPEWCRVNPSIGVTSYLLSWEGDRWVNWACGCSGSLCKQSGPGAVHLPGPAQAVVEVVVNGVALDPDQYVLEGDVLHRTGTTTVWPRQDLSRPLGEPNTWSVEYLRGNPVPSGVDRLTGLLAKEFLAACNGEKCRLPRTVTSVTRQGISYQVFDPNRIYDSGKTGLPEVDMWLAAVNPHKLTSPSSVL